MPTYAENAATVERAERRQRQDRFLAAQQAQFDQSVQENTDKRGGWKVQKHERAGFTVVTSSKEFRAGYDQIKWSDEPRTLAPKDLGLEHSDRTGSTG